MSGLPPAEVRAERARRVFELAEEIGHARAAGLEGRELGVLVESAEGDVARGRWRGQAPDVDGDVTFTGAATPGSIVSVRIDEARGYDLFGVAL
jgi:ribosomal protein S12 methylthiotransferase